MCKREEMKKRKKKHDIAKKKHDKIMDEKEFKVRRCK